MDLTSGAILRRIIATPLSVTAHKLATIILDGTSWKDGYNGLERGTAAFTLTHLIDLMGISRQHMSTLLGELCLGFRPGAFQARREVCALDLPLEACG